MRRLLLAGLVFLGTATHAHADDRDPIGTVYAAAQNNGLPAWKTERFVATARGESRFDPHALGDRGKSVGLFQLFAGWRGTIERPTNEGLLKTFYAWGYDDPWSAEDNADFAARVFARSSHADLCRLWSAYRVQYC